MFLQGLLNSFIGLLVCLVVRQKTVEPIPFLIFLPAKASIFVLSITCTRLPIYLLHLIYQLGCTFYFLFLGSEI